jgi:hypothetical protein
MIARLYTVPVAGALTYASAAMKLVLLPLPLALLATACNGKVTRQDCTEMLDKYLEMTTAGDPSLEGLSPSEAKAAREMKVALRKGEPAYLRVHDQCEAEISKKEYRCAMKADTPERWQACID